MPVVLPANRERQWIVPELSKEKAAELLVPIDDACLEAYTVPKLVPSAGSDANVPSAIAPYQYPELADGSPGQRTLF
jgi:putative SOS response-associated peptidase YedK